MTEAKAPKIEFPCAYPVKVMGLNVDNFHLEVLKIIRRHAPDLEDKDVKYRASRNGKYLAVNVIINATGVPQLEAMFQKLKDSGRVTMVL